MTKAPFWPHGYLDELAIEGFYTLESLSLKGLADKREIYFLGENGDGKTLLLQAIVLACKQVHFNTAPYIFKPSQVGKALDLLQEQPECKLRPKRLSTDRPPKPRDILGDSLFAYGVQRSRSSDDWDPHGFMTLFDDSATLRDPVSWLRYLYTRELEKNPVVTLETARAMLRQILDEGLDFEVNADSVTFIERGTRLSIAQLSEGYRSVMTWVLDLLARLSKEQPMIKDIRDFVGIVLVDEISLHLHPKWESKLVRQLRSWFPKIQFIFTTHSPITIMGASEDAVFYKVYKQDGKTLVSDVYENEDMRHLMANGLVTSPLFGLESARMSAFPEGEVPDTSESYLHSRIYTAVSTRVKALAQSGKINLSRADIDALVAKALDEDDL